MQRIISKVKQDRDTSVYIMHRWSFYIRNWGGDLDSLNNSIHAGVVLRL